MVHWQLYQPVTGSCGDCHWLRPLQLSPDFFLFDQIWIFWLEYNWRRQQQAVNPQVSFKPSAACNLFIVSLVVINKSSTDMYIKGIRCWEAFKVWHISSFDKITVGYNYKHMPQFFLFHALGQFGSLLALFTSEYSLEVNEWMHQKQQIIVNMSTAAHPMAKEHHPCSYQFDFEILWSF